MTKQKSQKRNRPLRIDKTPDVLLTPLNNIADNMGVTMTDLLRPEVRNIVDSYPEYLKRKPSQKKCKHCAIYGVPTKVIDELFNIADNLDISYAAILKIGFTKLEQGFPEKMKKPKPKF